MVTKKSLVLTSLNDDGKKAVLSLEYENQNLSGKLRLYNFSSEPNGILSLGLMDEKGVTKAGLSKEGNMLFSFATSIKEFPQDFSCALVNFVGGSPSPLLFGSSHGYGDKEKTLSEVVGALKGSKNVDEVESVLDDYGVDYDDDLKQEIQEEIDKAFEKEECFNDCKSQEKCNDCIYKKYFFEHNQTQNLSLNKQEEKIVPQEDTLEESEFYKEIKPQVEVLFSEYKPEEYLENSIPNSKWVKVDFEDEGDYYVFGLIYQDDELKYVCYGIPSVYSQNPPKQLSGYPTWFPLDKEKNDGFGYWLSYQDAVTGESVKAVIE